MNHHTFRGPENAGQPSCTNAFLASGARVGVLDPELGTWHDSNVLPVTADVTEQNSLAAAMHPGRAMIGHRLQRFRHDPSLRMLVVQEDRVWLTINCSWWLGRNGRLILRDAPVTD